MVRADACPLNRLIVEDILRRAGARTVALFESGTDAICEIVTREPNDYGAAILDIQMPGMDGIETATQLRNIAPQMPIVALSGDSDPAVHTRARDAGVVALLTKPVADDALLAAISGETTSGQWSATSGAMAARDVGESHVFDLGRMQRRFEGHETLVHKLLDTFRQRHLETSTKLQAAIVRDDWTTIGRSHTPSRAWQVICTPLNCIWPHRLPAAQSSTRASPPPLCRHHASRTGPTDASTRRPAHGLIRSGSNPGAAA